MGSINVGRLILAGLVISIVINVGEAVVNGWLMGPQWNDALTSLGRPGLGLGQILTFNVLGLIVGLAAAWVYAAARPRFGAGPRTAIYAGLLVWLLAYAMEYATMAVMAIMPPGLMATVSATSLVEVVIATLIGAAVYKEAEPNL
jgi:hypothetical protein